MPPPSRVPTHAFEALLARASAEQIDVATVSDEVAFWLYSSGSTGDPKGVKHVQTCLIATGRLFGQEVLGIGGNDVVFSAGKLFFAYGLANSMAFPMSVGATTILVPEPATPQKVIETMRKYHPTVFFGGPALYAALLVCGEIGPGADPNGSGAAFPEAIFCPRASASVGARPLASTSSRARGRPKF